MSSPTISTTITNPVSRRQCIIESSCQPQCPSHINWQLPSGGYPTMENVDHHVVPQERQILIREHHHHYNCGIPITNTHAKFGCTPPNPQIQPTFLAEQPMTQNFGYAAPQEFNFAFQYGHGVMAIAPGVQHFGQGINQFHPGSAPMLNTAPYFSGMANNMNVFPPGMVPVVRKISRRRV